MTTSTKMTITMRKTLTSCAPTKTSTVHYSSDDTLSKFVTRPNLFTLPHAEEEYEDEADDYYEKYSDEDELRCADAEDQQSQHAFEDATRSGAYRSINTNDSSVDEPHLDEEEKKHDERVPEAVADSPPPPVSPTEETDEKQTEPREYDDEDDDYERVGDYDDEEEYDEDSHGVSDVDDSELMQRLESKYGKLSTPAVVDDSEEEFVRTDSPPVAPARR